jgi:hypothetical protein
LFCRINTHHLDMTLFYDNKIHHCPCISRLMNIVDVFFVFFLSFVIRISRVFNRNLKEGTTGYFKVVQKVPFGTFPWTAKYYKWNIHSENERETYYYPLLFNKKILSVEQEKRWISNIKTFHKKWLFLLIFLVKNNILETL